MAKGVTLADRLAWLHPDWTWERCQEVAAQATDDQPAKENATQYRPRIAVAQQQALKGKATR